MRRVGGWCVVVMLVMGLTSVPAIAGGVAAGGVGAIEALAAQAQAPSWLEQLGAHVGTLISNNLVSVVTFVLGLLGSAWVGMSAMRKRRLALIIKHAFYAVEDLKAECVKSGKDFPFLTKAEAALKAANEYCVARGWRELSAREATQARLDWRALHGAEKVTSSAFRAVAAAVTSRATTR